MRNDLKAWRPIVLEVLLHWDDLQWSLNCEIILLVDDGDKQYRDAHVMLLATSCFLWLCYGWAVLVRLVHFNETSASHNVLYGSWRADVAWRLGHVRALVRHAHYRTSAPPLPNSGAPPTTLHHDRLSRWQHLQPLILKAVCLFLPGVKSATCTSYLMTPSSSLLQTESQPMTLWWRMYRPPFAILSGPKNMLIPDLRGSRTRESFSLHSLNSGSRTWGPYVLITSSRLRSTLFRMRLSPSRTNSKVAAWLSRNWRSSRWKQLCADISLGVHGRSTRSKELCMGLKWRKECKRARLLRSRCLRLVPRRNWEIMVGFLCRKTTFWRVLVLKICLDENIHPDKSMVIHPSLKIKRS